MPAEFDPNSGSIGVPLITTHYKLGLGVCYEFNGVTPQHKLKFYQHTSPCGKPVFPNAIEQINTQLTDVQLFPNPAQNEITITATENISGIRVTDLLGRTMFENKYSNRKISVDIQQLPEGVYFLHINENTIRRFVKQ